MPDLLETLAAELERPRELSDRVINYLTGNYGIDYDTVGSFLVEELPKLEDYELDLILSPVFTPRLADQAAVAATLGREAVPREQWPALVHRLAERPTRARLITRDGRTHRVTLREVTLERYVHRLRLDGSIPESLFMLVDRAPAENDRALLKAVARSAIWENDSRREILERYLSLTGGREGYDAGEVMSGANASPTGRSDQVMSGANASPTGRSDQVMSGANASPTGRSDQVMSGANASPTGRSDQVVALLTLIETNKPANLPDFLAWIPRRQDTLQEQINAASGSKPFFSSRVQDLHGGERDQRLPDDRQISSKQTELEFLTLLQQVFGTFSRE